MLQNILLIAIAVGLQFHGASSHDTIRNNSLEFSVSADDRMTTFIHTDGYVYHMEPDLHIPGNILYTDNCAIKTTDGVTSTTIAGHSNTCYYHEGVGTLARFYSITGFRQISATEIVVVDHNHHCLRLVHRITLQTSRFAGYCKSYGYAQGTSGARFYFPWSVISDNRRTGMLIVTDRSNDALRHVNSLSGNPRTVSTIMKSSTLNDPYGVTQDPKTGDLYVTTYQFVFKVTYSSQSISHITSNSGGFRDCDFSVSMLHYPKEIILIDLGTKLITADQYNNRLRVLNLNISTTTSLCFGRADHTDGDMSTCTLYYPHSLMVLNNTLFVGENQRIRKVQDIKKTTCDDPYIREVASPDTGVANVEVPLLEGSGKLRLQPGSYPFDVSGKYDCTVMLKVSDHRLRRRLVFTSDYNVDCERATGNLTNSSLTHQLARRAFMRQLTEICLDDCNRANNSDVEMTCTNLTLTLIWPTDVSYSGDVIQIPTELESRLTSRIVAKGAAFYLVLLQNTPPVVFPTRLTNSGFIRAQLSSHCTDGLLYSPDLDNCE